MTKIAEEEKKQIPEQIELCHKFQNLIQTGDYYRISSWSDQKPYDCWEVAAKDGSEALVTYVQVLGKANVHSRIVQLKGLDPDSVYKLEETGEIFTGEELLYCGFLVKDIRGDYQSRLYHFIRMK